MLGAGRRFESAPFFWTEQFGSAIRYVGHGAGWKQLTVEGDLESGAFIVRYFADGVHLATASVGRDLDNLEDELSLENHIRA